jgi:Leucine-rich repeat (LRR) protein
MEIEFEKSGSTRTKPLTHPSGTGEFKVVRVQKEGRVMVRYMFVFIFMTCVLTFAQDKIDYKVKSLEINPSNSFLFDQLHKFKNLEKLSIVCLEELRAIPSVVGSVKSLVELNLDQGNGCTMNVELPESIGYLTHLKVLNLDGAQDFSLRKVTNGLPEGLAKLKKLEILNLSRGPYKRVPDIVKALENLKELYLGYLDIEVLPDWVGLSKIQKIYLTNNSDIYCSPKKQESFLKKFPKIEFDFNYEWDIECPKGTL